MKYYIGPLTWITEAGMSFWRAPVGSKGMIDLGSFADMANPGSDRGTAFIATDALLPSEYAFLGDGDLRGVAVDGLMQDAWFSHTKYRPNGDRLVDLLFDHLTNGSDPLGASACKPIVPDTTGWMDLYLGGHSKVKAYRFEWGTHPHTNKLKALLHRELLEVRRASHAGEMRNKQGQVNNEFHRGFIQALMEKYRIGFDDIRPNGWPANETPLSHETTITENFNTADSDTLGPTLTWSEVTGDWDVVSNGAAKVANNEMIESARAQSDLSGSDHYCQVKVLHAVENRASGPATRHSSSASTYYAVYNYSNSVNISKIIGGSITSLGSAAYTLVMNDVFKNENNGSSLKAYINAVEKVSVTDTSITGNTRCGLFQFGSNAGPDIDDFEAADLGAGGGVLYTQYERRIRGFVRGMYMGAA